ncbi:FkbM family methyltransferase [Pseudoruegeria sp. HB172150]|uniref:FkbM family methyltransferase n=1 Tax=Pseudoruegeria sp. HB172150 TaxID=2721164 RepID=UPI0020A65E52|nr:FkbM family methyltransferase [Pseudoruegeria sp. HB172150]
MISAKYTFRMYIGSLARRTSGLFLKSDDNKIFARNYSRIANLFLRRGQSNPVSIEFNEDNSLFLVKDGEKQIYVARRERLEMQAEGIDKRQNGLAQTYIGGAVTIEPGDIVLDCGANIGEFSIYCASKGARTYSFEPDPREFKALVANCTAAMTPVNKALSDKPGVLRFFDRNESGDSSLIDPGNANQVLEVEATTLNEFVEGIPNEAPIKLLKLEAEGAEPEVLAGSENALKRIHYIAAALGPERGASKETTLAPVTDFLYAHGFRMVHFGTRYYVAVFENSELTAS